jgi:hypothetical protein
MAKSKQVNRLLKKKGWTGAEIGKLLIASFLNDIQQYGKEEKKLLFSQSDFEEMESTLTSDRDFLVYGVYKNLYSGIIDSYNRGQGLYQQFYNGFYRLLNNFQNVQYADELQRSLDFTPLIMTESQYKRLKADAIQKLREQKDSYYSLIFFLLEKFLDAGEETPEPIKRAIETTKKEPAKNKIFSSSYNELMGEGYYSLPDGRRSDQMTKEQWHKALKQENLKDQDLTIELESTIEDLAKDIKEFAQTRFTKSCKLFFKGADAIREFVLKKTGETLGNTDEEIEEALSDVMNQKEEPRYRSSADKIKKALGYDTLGEWHVYEELPEGLTSFDLLEQIIDSAQYVNTDPKKHLKTFKTDYPELYKTLNAYIEENIPQARGLKSDQLYKEIISWGELADAGIIGYKDRIQPNEKEIVQIWTEGENTTESKTKRFRENNGGIAILKNPSKSQIDENGDYVEENPLNDFFQSQNLYSLEDDEEAQQSIYRYIHNLIYPAIRYLYAFNALMKILEEVYDVENLAEGTRLSTTYIELEMENYNDSLYRFYFAVYGNEVEKRKKRTIIKEIYHPLETGALLPTKEAIEEVKAELIKLGFSSNAKKSLQYLDTFIDHLMYSGEGA